MARKRDPKRDEAFNLFKNSDGKITNREIANLLEVPERTISSWKLRDKWNEVLQTGKRSTSNNNRGTSKKGAPFGNQNAVGNKGNSRASPPIGNKNAVKTGEFEKIYYDLLDDDEKAIYSADFSLRERLEQDIQELTMRKYRMMKRIREAEQGLNLVESEKLYELRGRKQYIDSEKGGKKISIEIPQITMTEMKEKSIRKIEDILRIEDALTRMSNQLSKAIKQLEELELNERRKELLIKQTEKADAEIRRLRIQNGDVEPDEIGDDGFIAAIKGIATDSEVWEDDTIET